MKRTAEQLRDEQRTLDTWKRQLKVKRTVSRDEWNGPRPIPTKIACRQCEGSGWMELPAAYEQTLAVMTVEWQSTTEINKRLPRLKATALCNRLADMRRDGIVERRLRAGSAKVYEWRIRCDSKETP